MAKEITQPTDEQIRTRAYYLWEADGRPHGRDWEYWTKAQQEFAARAVQAEKPSVQPAKKAVAVAAEKAPATATKRRTASRSAVLA